MYTLDDYYKEYDLPPIYRSDYGVSCALPDLRYLFYAALGAVVIASALVMWMVKRG